ncbi:MAG TPA: DUF885 domain-containing protein [Candidatus Acidoferrum sp.]|nr:DUF885 domain-containing protein [Candidatus Acidoferrum sp.]
MNHTGKEFEGLLSRYFETLLHDNPTLCTMSAGLPDGEGKLGQLSSEYHRKRERERQRALAALDGISPRELSAEQQIDRLAFRSLLLKECEDYARGRHTLEPGAPEHVLSILLHELLRGDDEPARAARNLRSLLRQAPEFLAQAATVVRRPERVWLRVMEQAAAGGKALLEGVREFLQQAGSASADDSLVEAAGRAVERYGQRIRQCPPAPAGSFAVGAPALQRRVRDELGLDYTLGQVEALAQGEVRRVGSLLAAACARFGRNRPAESIIAEARASWRPAGDLPSLYRTEVRRVAEGFRRAKAVSFPDGDLLQVKPVPEFLRPIIPTAAYLQPPAFAKRQRGVFWVSDQSLGRQSEAERLAEQQQHFGLPLTCAHEAYPGHHLQFVTANNHHRRWRRLFAHAVFYEGWTLWCEQMLLDLKVDRSPWLPVLQLHDALWRCHRILVDVRLQTGRYSYEQAVRHLQREVGFTRARAQADVNWYTAQPAVPMSYWLGRLENERLRRRLIAGRGWSLRRFNDWLLSFGTVPQAWIEKYGLD